MGDFLITVCEWAWEHCRQFPADLSVQPSEVEHPLHFTELHKQYRELFEARTRAFVGGVLGLSDEEFLTEAAKLLKQQEDGYSPVFDALTNSEDYESFFRYMQRIHS